METAVKLAEINEVDRKSRNSCLRAWYSKNLTINELKDLIEKNNIVLSLDEEKTPEL